MKQRKQILAVLLVLQLFLVLPALAQESMVTGSWEIDYLVIDGETYPDAQDFFPCDVQLYADGSALMTANGDSGVCTWWIEDDGTIYIDDGYSSLSCTLSADGTLLCEEPSENIVLAFKRTSSLDASDASLDSAAGNASCSILTAYGYSVELPAGWFQLSPETFQLQVDLFGEAMIEETGLSPSLLDDMVEADMCIFYSSDLTANFNIVLAPADGMTTSVLPLLSSYLQDFYTAQGFTDIVFDGPVEFGGISYYTTEYSAFGTYQRQYLCIENEYLYTITMTNVPAEERELILSGLQPI